MRLSIKGEDWSTISLNPRNHSAIVTDRAKNLDCHWDLCSCHGHIEDRRSSRRLGLRSERFPQILFVAKAHVHQECSEWRRTKDSQENS